MRKFVLMALLLGCVSAPQRALKAPERMPKTARPLIGDRMVSHGVDMTNLLWAVLFDDREMTERLARSIGEGPKIARPIRKDATEMNSRIPPAFFEMQDALSEAAVALATVAARQEAGDAEIASAFGQVTQTCVRCHSAFLSEDHRLSARHLQETPQGDDVDASPGTRLAELQRRRSP